MPPCIARPRAGTIKHALAGQRSPRIPYKDVVCWDLPDIEDTYVSATMRIADGVQAISNAHC